MLNPVNMDTEGTIESACINEVSPYKTSSAAAAFQNGFKKSYKWAVKGLAAAVANFGCLMLH